MLDRKSIASVPSQTFGSESVLAERLQRRDRLFESPVEYPLDLCNCRMCFLGCEDPLAH